jgi:hypothetical protein
MKKFILFIILCAVVVGGFMYYKNKTKPSPIVPGRQDDTVFCTADVKECPDGSFVGRVGPTCQFAPCPTSTR